MEAMSKPLRTYTITVTEKVSDLLQGVKKSAICRIAAYALDHENGIDAKRVSVTVEDTTKPAEKPVNHYAESFPKQPQFIIGEVKTGTAFIDWNAEYRRRIDEGASPWAAATYGSRALSPNHPERQRKS